MFLLITEASCQDLLTYCTGSQTGPSWISQSILLNFDRILVDYTLISIRQNYNFDMLAMTWHEIVCWFLKIYQDLKRFVATGAQNCFCFWFFLCAKQFYVPNMQELSKAGKKSEINRQTFIIWWLNSRSYRSVWYLFSCICPSDFHTFRRLCKELRSVRNDESLQTHNFLGSPTCHAPLNFKYFLGQNDSKNSIKENKFTS